MPAPCTCGPHGCPLMPSADPSRPLRQRRRLLVLLGAVPACAMSTALPTAGVMLVVVGPDVGAGPTARLASLGRGAGLRVQRAFGPPGRPARVGLRDIWQRLDHQLPPGPLVIAAQGAGVPQAIRLAADLETARRPLLLALVAAAGEADLPMDDLARFEARCAADSLRAPALLLIEGDADTRLPLDRRQARLAALPSATVIGIPGARAHELLADPGYRTALQSLLRGWLHRHGAMAPLSACEPACSRP
jgi:hypothetical protein